MARKNCISEMAMIQAILWHEKHCVTEFIPFIELESVAWAIVTCGIDATYAVSRPMKNIGLAGSWVD